MPTYQQVGQKSELEGDVLILMAHLLQQLDGLLPVLAVVKVRDDDIVEQLLITERRYSHPCKTGLLTVEGGDGGWQTLRS